MNNLIEKFKDKDFNMGLLMVLIGILIWVLPVKMVLTLFVIYGLVQIFWKKEERIRDVHHHHHHHTTSNVSKKKTSTTTKKKVRKNSA